MVTAATPTTSAIEGTSAATRGRDRFISAGRGMAIIVVVFVHWGLAVTDASGLGILSLATVTGQAWLGWVSWVFVGLMPLYFAMFGALSMRAARGRPRTFYRRRLTRLLIPYYVFAAVMITVELSLRAGGIGNCATGASSNPFFRLDALKALSWVVPFPHFDCLGLTQAPLWFLSVLIMLTFLLPLLVRIYDRPRLRLKALVAFPLAAFGLDLASFAAQQMTGVPRTTPGPLWLLQFAVVWGFFAYFGFFYADRAFASPRVHRALPWAALALVTLTALLSVGPYPDALLSESNGNQFPPTATYLLGGAAVLCFLVWVREAFVRFADLRGVSTIVDWLDTNNYSIYLWHNVALTATYWAARGMGLVGTAGNTSMVHGLPLFAERLFWVVAPLPALVLLVKVFHPVEAWSFPPAWWVKRREAREAEAAAPA